MHRRWSGCCSSFGKIVSYVIPAKAGIQVRINFINGFPLALRGFFEVAGMTETGGIYVRIL